PLMRTACRAHTFVALVAAVLCRVEPAAATDPVRGCQETVAKAGTTLVAKILHVEEACLRKVARGRLPAATRCVGTGGDLTNISNAAVRAKVDAAIGVARTDRK